ncbi:MAG: YvcK family protein [Candidatus Brennerbacteria bacterium]|nr:YvcK family protein [Candidatus Brennerbacteria bacterium]
MSKPYPQKKIVVIGGGTGVFTVLTGLRKYFSDLTAVVTMSDDGGSTGILREEFGILPPGDVRRSLVALARTDNEILARLFNYRFEEGAGLNGHSFGNLMLTALERLTGSFDLAVKEAGRILAVQGQVLPVTLKNARLYAELDNGKIVRGETNIDIPKYDIGSSIKKIWLKPQAVINPEVSAAILKADAVLIGPGDLYTSLIPNFLVKGMNEILKKSRAKKIYFVNVMTKYGETHGFSASDFLKTLERYLGKGILDFVVINNKKPGWSRMKNYVQEKAELVQFDRENFANRPTVITADLLRSKGMIRHDPDKIANIVKMVL